MYEETVATLTSPALKPPVSAAELAHRDLRDDEYWREIPGYADLTAAEFHDHRFQLRNSVTSLRDLGEVLGGRVSPSFLEDVAAGLERSTMSLRVSPYVLSLIDWREPYTDPLRLQFVPVGSRMLPDHPELTLDALDEQRDSPVPGLTHRYLDRALFLTLDTCPVYCRFCTRSYAVGLDTEGVEKVHFGANQHRWQHVFAYVESRPELEDVVISGGDVSQLKAEQLERIGMRLLSIDHVRRLRFATKAPAIMPQKLVTDHLWVDALTRVVEAGRQRHKEVAVHTHFNHPNEITAISRQGLDRLMERGVTVRNQTVLLRGVNDQPAVMARLIRRLSFVNVHPYYVFVHDLIRGVEELRTPLHTALRVEKEIRGITAGFNTPTFVVDTLGGGGKRNAHSFEHYDREHGISVFTSPAVRPGRLFYYFDPLDTLTPAAQVRWQDPDERQALLAAAARAAEAGQRA
ncbi:MAG: KamA family radical SAM protein [Candidatus Latescibacterota bacterium]|jgi:lysine 2,3-aminomutase